MYRTKKAPSTKFHGTPFVKGIGSIFQIIEPAISSVRAEHSQVLDYQVFSEDWSEIGKDFEAAIHGIVHVYFTDHPCDKDLLPPMCKGSRSQQTTYRVLRDEMIEEVLQQR